MISSVMECIFTTDQKQQKQSLLYESLEICVESRLFILSLRLSLQFWRFVMQISAPAPLCPRVISHLCSNRCVQEQPWSGSKWWQLALYHSTEPSQVTHR